MTEQSTGIKVSLEISGLGLALRLLPEFDHYQPIFEIDSDHNVLVQGKRVGKLNEEMKVIF